MPQEHNPISTRAFHAILALFVAASAALAWANNSPGSADSCANLTLARNIVQGHGYVSFGVGQLWEPQPIPSPETIKPPGLAYLTASLFALFGTSLAIPVALNAIAIIADALLLRTAITWTSGKRLGNYAGLLVLVSRNYELVSLWNNNILTTLHSSLLLVAASRRRGLRDGGDPGDPFRLRVSDEAHVPAQWRPVRDPDLGR